MTSKKILTLKTRRTPKDKAQYNDADELYKKIARHDRFNDMETHNNNSGYELIKNVRVIPYYDYDNEYKTEKEQRKNIIKDFLIALTSVKDVFKGQCVNILSFSSLGYSSTKKKFKNSFHFRVRGAGSYLVKDIPRATGADNKVYNKNNQLIRLPYCSKMDFDKNCLENRPLARCKLINGSLKVFDITDIGDYCGAISDESYSHYLIQNITDEIPANITSNVPKPDENKREIKDQPRHQENKLSKTTIDMLVKINGNKHILNWYPVRESVHKHTTTVYYARSASLKNVAIECQWCDRTHTNDNHLIVKVICYKTLMLFYKGCSKSKGKKFEEIHRCFIKQNTPLMDNVSTIEDDCCKLGYDYKKVNSRYLQSLSLDKHRFINIRSPTGSGKTYKMAKILKDRYINVVYVSFRTSQIKELVNGKFNDLSFQSQKGITGAITDKVKRVLLQIESLARLRKTEIELLILDEFYSIIQQLSLSPFIKNNSVFINFKRMIERSNKVLTLDANLTPDVFANAMKRMEITINNCIFVHNVYKPPRCDVNIGCLSNKEYYTSWKNKIKKLISRCKQVLISSTAGVSRQTQQVLDIFGVQDKDNIANIIGKKALIINKETINYDNVKAFITNPNEECKKYILVSFSPTINAGFSIDDGEDIHIFADFNNTTIDHYTQAQLLDRARNSKHPINILMNNSNTSFPSGVRTLKNIINNKLTYLQKSEDIKHNLDTILKSFPQEVENNKYKYVDIGGRFNFMVWNLSRMNNSKNNIYGNLKNLLQIHGYNVTDMMYSDEITPSGVKNKDKINYKTMYKEYKADEYYATSDINETTFEHYSELNKSVGLSESQSKQMAKYKIISSYGIELGSDKEKCLEFFTKYANDNFIKLYKKVAKTLTYGILGEVKNRIKLINDNVEKHNEVKVGRSVKESNEKHDPLTFKTYVNRAKDVNLRLVLTNTLVEKIKYDITDDTIKKSLFTVINVIKAVFTDLLSDMDEKQLYLYASMLTDVNIENFAQMLSDFMEYDEWSYNMEKINKIVYSCGLKLVKDTKSHGKMRRKLMKEIKLSVDGDSDVALMQENLSNAENKLKECQNAFKNKEKNRKLYKDPVWKTKHEGEKEQIKTLKETVKSLKTQVKEAKKSKKQIKQLMEKTDLSKRVAMYNKVKKYNCVGWYKKIYEESKSDYDREIYENLNNMLELFMETFNTKEDILIDQNDRELANNLLAYIPAKKIDVFLQRPEVFKYDETDEYIPCMEVMYGKQVEKAEEAEETEKTEEDDFELISNYDDI